MSSDPVSVSFTHIGDLQRLSVSFPHKSDVENKKNVILVCDTSGSMNGTPKQQVLEVVEHLSQIGLDFMVVNYSTKAIIVKPMELRKTWFNEGTYFRNAFSTTLDLLKSHEKYQKYYTDIVFLTDGDPSDDPMEWNRWSPSYCDMTFKKFCSLLPTVCKCATIHAFGLGSSHNSKLLQAIQNGGMVPGVYSYADPTKSSSVLVAELSTVLTFVMNTMSGMVSFLDKDCRVLGKKDIDFCVEDDKMRGNLWLHQLNEEIPAETVTLSFSVDDTQQVTQVQLSDVQTCVPDHFAVLGSIQVRLQDLCKNMTLESLPEKNGLLEALQCELDSMKLLRINKSEKNVVIQEVMQVQVELDEVRRLWVDISNKRMTSNEMIARVTAMKYRGRLSKARQQRTMDKRSIHNADMLLSLSKKLQELELNDASDLYIEHEEELHDNISQQSLTEILTDPEFKTDILCIGVNVKRTAVAIDCPTTISVSMTDDNGTPCTTMFSWDTFETAAMFEMNRTSQEQATGDFNYDSISCVLSGQGRENINACLPIYGCESQYRRARLLLPIMCGYLFTLSESGYSPSQIVALYAILARFTRTLMTCSEDNLTYTKKKNVSDRSIFMLEQYRLLCARLLMDTEIFDILKVPKNMRPLMLLERFCSDPESHQKSELPTLDIFYGIMIAARGNETIQKKIVGNGSIHRIVLCEALRRHMNWNADRRQKGSKVFWEYVPSIMYEADDYVEKVSILSECTLYGIEKKRFRQIKFNPYSEIMYKEPDGDDAFKCSIELFKRLFNGDILTVSSFSKVTGCIGLQMSETVYQSILPISMINALWACGNDVYSECVSSRIAILDPADISSCMHLLTSVHTHFEKARKQQWETNCETLKNEKHAEFAVHTDSVSDFARVLKGLRVGRGQSIWENIVKRMLPDDPDTTKPETYVPDFHAKLALMLCGHTSENEMILDSGWMAGETLGKRIRDHLTGTEFENVLTKMDSMTMMHCYRASGKPNQHGHSKDNPLWVAKPNDRNIPSLIKKWDI